MWKVTKKWEEEVENIYKMFKNFQLNTIQICVCYRDHEEWTQTTGEKEKSQPKHKLNEYQWMYICCCGSPVQDFGFALKSTSKRAELSEEHTLSVCICGWLK